MKKYGSLFLCFLPLLLWGQNPEKTHGLQLDLGSYHFSMLDHQASPVGYALNAPTASLGYQHRNTKHLVEAGLYFTFGQLKAKAYPLITLLDKNTLTAYAFGLHFDYLKPLKSDMPWTQHVGASFAYDFIIDFEAVANFPWGMGQGRLDLAYQGTYSLPNAHQLSVKIKAPLVGVVTRLPYSNIPRVLGKIAGVSSFFEVGTSIVSWDSYQHLSIETTYTLALNEKWRLSPTYHFSYFAHNKPDKIRAYKQVFTIALSYDF